MKLTPQDLSLFIGQEVQIVEGIGILETVSQIDCIVQFKEDLMCPELREVKPICRRMEDMTDEENLEAEKHISNADHWNYIKYLTSKGFCPFEEWLEEGLVIELVYA